MGGLNFATYPNGSVAQHDEYMPFGETRLETGTADLHHKFTDQEEDSEFGLYYYGARYYDPVLGRFISPDSIVPSPENPQALNRYSYCLNNPLVYTDPTGHFSWLALLGFMALGAGAGASIAAISGGDVGMGALTGAISAGAFFGAGQAIAALGLVTQAGAYTSTGAMFAASGIHVGTGAAVGAVNAAITGGDVGMGALTGGISAGVGKLLGGYIPHLDNEIADFAVGLAGHSAIGGVSGGIAAEIYGGDFGEGFGQGAWTAGFGFTFNRWQPVLMRGIMYLERTPAGRWISGLSNRAGNWIISLFSRGGSASAGARTEAANLAEQLALQVAKSGGGQRIMQGSINDPAFPENTWAKMQYLHRTPDGQNIVIHYWERISDGFRTGFKFKN